MKVDLNDVKISEADRKSKHISNLADRPNAPNSYGKSKMDAQAVKQAFDAQFDFLVDKHNKLVEGQGSLNDIYGSLADALAGILAIQESIGNVGFTIADLSGVNKAIEQINDFLEYVHPDEQGEANIFDRIYPVGSIYMSANSTSPAALFGGTWTRLTDRFLLGASDPDSQEPAYPLGATDGEAKHKLTAAELPTHTHKAALVNTSWGGSASGLDTAKVGTITTTGSTQQALIITPDYDSTLGWSHNNMPPYLAVYMWKREA